MHNVISSCFFPSGELCRSEGGIEGRGVYVGGSGRTVVGAGGYFFFMVFFLSLSLF